MTAQISKIETSILLRKMLCHRLFQKKQKFQSTSNLKIIVKNRKKKLTLMKRSIRKKNSIISNRMFKKSMMKKLNRKIKMSLTMSTKNECAMKIQTIFYRS